MTEHLGPKVGDMTREELVRFVQNIIRLHPPATAGTLTAEGVDVVKMLKCFDQVQFLQNRTTVGTAGGASALPATPTGYIPILDYSGNTKLIPYYNAP